MNRHALAVDHAPPQPAALETQLPHRTTHPVSHHLPLFLTTFPCSHHPPLFSPPTPAHHPPLLTTHPYSPTPAHHPPSIAQVLTSKYGFEEEDATKFAEFLLPMMDYSPTRRATATETLQQPWIKSEVAELGLPITKAAKASSAASSTRPNASAAASAAASCVSTAADTIPMPEDFMPAAAVPADSVPPVPTGAAASATGNRPAAGSAPAPAAASAAACAAACAATSSTVAASAPLSATTAASAAASAATSATTSMHASKAGVAQAGVAESRYLLDGLIALRSPGTGAGSVLVAFYYY